HQIIGTGELETIKVQKPAFVLGERVMLCTHDKGTKQRLILGIKKLKPLQALTYVMLDRHSVYHREHPKLEFFRLWVR
ncbi:MAG: DUF1392 family protein, partial [Nostoc indistinguendum CM1-VF10]|nr:DUF1392 family protein [Nostoc indistinguendum CM1-VF10]